VLSWCDSYAIIETSAAVMINDLASGHGLAIWDSVVLAAAGA
jgi:predicted nucleic acid-binding protein